MWAAQPARNTAEVLDVTYPRASITPAVKWHKSSSSSSAAIKPQVPVKAHWLPLTSTIPPLSYKTRSHKTTTGLILTLHVSSVSRRMDNSCIKMSWWIFWMWSLRLGIHIRQFICWRSEVRTQMLQISEVDAWSMHMWFLMQTVAEASVYRPVISIYQRHFFIMCQSRRVTWSECALCRMSH